MSQGDGIDHAQLRSEAIENIRKRRGGHLRVATPHGYKSTTSNREIRREMARLISRRKKRKRGGV